MKEIVRSLPSSPGVYLMKDSENRVIYVGKSKNLKQRVQSYFYQSSSHPRRTKILVSQIRDIEIRMTDTEFEAFMLECALIREMKPMYNIKMKNPGAYSYIVSSVSGGLRRLEVSGVPGPDLSFGPYTAGQQTVSQALETLLESLKLSCRPPYGGSAACLNHALGKCLGMCQGGEPEEAYHRLLDRVAEMIGTSSPGLYEELAASMEEAADRFEFERAARLRDALKAADHLRGKEKVIGFAEENRSMAVYERLGDTALKLFLIKGNRVLLGRKLDLNGTAPEELARAVCKDIKAAFPGGGELAPAVIGAEEVDEAQIIYSYLQSSTCSHMTIPDEWLPASAGRELERQVEAWLAPCFLPPEE